MALIDLELDTDAEVGRNIQILNNTFGPMRFALFSNGGAGYGSNVGNVTISGNTQVGPLVSCVPTIYVEPNTAGMYRSGYTITNNHLLAFGDAMQLTRANNVTVSGNTVQFTNGQCGHDAGVTLFDSHTVSVTNNAFRGFGQTVKMDTLSTGVIDSGNTR
jgi:hypothetical protein